MYRIYIVYRVQAPYNPHGGKSKCGKSNRKQPPICNRFLINQALEILQWPGTLENMLGLVNISEKHKTFKDINNRVI